MLVGLSTYKVSVLRPGFGWGTTKLSSSEEPHKVAGAAPLIYLSIPRTQPTSFVVSIIMLAFRQCIVHVPFRCLCRIVQNCSSLSPSTSAVSPINMIQQTSYFLFLKAHPRTSLKAPPNTFLPSLLTNPRRPYPSSTFHPHVIGISTPVCVFPPP